VREAMGLTQGKVASRMAVKRQSLAHFEVAEEQRSISLSSLERVAAAMDCELVYFLVPKGRADRTFTDLARFHDPAALHAEATAQSMALDGQDTSG
jgi:transcriptional regulator with XRE-family HTH domain